MKYIECVTPMQVLVLFYLGLYALDRLSAAGVAVAAGICVLWALERIEAAIKGKK